jgi:hypothetical protein
MSNKKNFNHTLMQDGRSDNRDIIRYMKISKTPFFLLGLIVLLIVAAAALGFASQFSLDTKK